MTPAPLDTWFEQHVLPLEAVLSAYLRRRCRDAAHVADLRQEVYVRVYEAARKGPLPRDAGAYVLSTARHLLIDQLRRVRVVAIDAVADLDELPTAPVELRTPERASMARQELRLLQLGLERLPPRCREVFELRKLDGLSQREVAQRLGIAEQTVERQTALGLRALADFMLARAGLVRRAPPSAAAVGRQVQP